MSEPQAVPIRVENQPPTQKRIRQSPPGLIQNTTFNAQLGVTNQCRPPVSPKLQMTARVQRCHWPVRQMLPPCFRDS